MNLICCGSSVHFMFWGLRIVLWLSTTTTLVQAITETFDITGMDATFNCFSSSNNSSQLESPPGCILRIPAGTTVDNLTAPLSFCPSHLKNSTVVWAPTDPSVQTLTIQNCSQSCSAYCSDECTCSSSTVGSCPTVPTAAPLIGDIPDPAEFPILPTTCPTLEQMAAILTHSALRCPYLMADGELPSCSCTYVFCNSDFLGCGPVSNLACADTTAIVTRCVLSDRLCPRLPTPAPVPSSAPMADAPIPTCETSQVTDPDTCKQGCFDAGISTSTVLYESLARNINEESIMGTICECTGTAFCFTATMDTDPPTREPSSSSKGVAIIHIGIRGIWGWMAVLVVSDATSSMFDMMMSGISVLLVYGAESLHY
ncbi:hypothetical protein ACA910_020248 [Epithemia clementina (nom. ined.)]